MKGWLEHQRPAEAELRAVRVGQPDQRSDRREKQLVRRRRSPAAGQHLIGEDGKQPDQMLLIAIVTAGKING